MNKIHYVISCNKDEIYEKYIAKSLKNKPYVHKINNSDELNSMTKKYNYAVNNIKDLSDDDIIVFIHDDVYIVDESFEGKLRLGFTNPDVGIIGVYGTKAWNGGGWWNYERPTYAVGKILQGYNPEKITAQGHIINDICDDRLFALMQDNMHQSIDSDMLLVDGCMIAVKGKLAKQLKWDETIYGYHHYDNKYCFDTLMETDFKIAVIDTLIAHVSEGDLTEGWREQAISLHQIYINKGIEFPITLKTINEHKQRNTNG